MTKYRDIGKVLFKDNTMILMVDGKEYSFALTDISQRLANASPAERAAFEISPSGYGIHWPLIDEDLSIDGLLGIRRLERANINSMIASLLSAIGILARWGFPFLGIPLSKIGLFTPWAGPGILSFFELAVVSLLTFMVYKKSRFAALSLFLVYVLDRAFTFIWLYIFSTTFIIIWLFVTLFWGVIFVQGIRGTFAYHRLKDKPLRKVDMKGK